ncbi:hypothetical protein [Kitasatospora sp. GP82]|uniref:hypothetical protein n=1 Tax=Kitasatospora sp. GP82 TaxID=3035089 RepID=UPI002473D93D|nr:hypothetical protein [Kitasatospora sp. GP82]MDH6129794.1 cell division septum initiation protein DivIVA [Kitasatospora sp. GP82]
MARIEMPDKRKVPPGPHRELLFALHQLHEDAGWPGGRWISQQIKAQDYSGSMSHERFRTLMRGEGFPRWINLEPVVRVLTLRSIPARNPDADATRLQALWKAAEQAQQTAPPLPMPSPLDQPNGIEAASTALTDPEEQANRLLLEAEVQASRMVSEASADASRVLLSAGRKAESLLTEIENRRASAEAEAEALRAQAADELTRALRDARDMRIVAEAEARRIVEDTQALREARAEARRVVQEARNEAERITVHSQRELGALSRRRADLDSEISRVQDVLTALESVEALAQAGSSEAEFERACQGAVRTMLAGAETEACRIVDRARAEAQRITDEGRREVDELVRRRRDLNREIARTQDVVDALEMFEHPPERL